MRAGSIIVPLELAAPWRARSVLTSRELEAIEKAGAAFAPGARLCFDLREIRSALAPAQGYARISAA
jgi:hypothetical protein